MAGPLILQQWEAYRVEINDPAIADSDTMVAKLQNVTNMCPERGKQEMLLHGHPSALHCAIQRNKTRVARWLIEAGCPINALSSTESRSPIWYACQAGNIEMVKYLLQRPGVDLAAGEHALISAVRSGQLPVALHIQAQPLTLTDAQRREVIQLAARHGQRFNEVLQKWQTPMEQWVHYFSDAVIATTTTSQVEVVRGRLTGTDRDSLEASICSQGTHNALLSAAYARRADLVKWLVSTARFNVNYQRSSDRATALHIACQNRDLPTVKCLVENCNANCEVRDSSNRIPLESIIERSYFTCHNEDIAKILAPKSPSFKLSIWSGSTLNQQVLRSASLKLLVSLNCINLSEQNSSGQGILSHCCGNKEQITLLLGLGMSFTDKDFNDLSKLVSNRIGGGSTSAEAVRAAINGALIPVEQKLERTTAELQAVKSRAPGTSNLVERQVAELQTWKSRVTTDLSKLTEDVAAAVKRKAEVVDLTDGDRLAQMEARMTKLAEQNAELREALNLMSRRLEAQGKDVETVVPPTFADEELRSLNTCKTAEFHIRGVKGWGDFGVVLEAECVKAGHPAPAGRTYALKAVFPAGALTTNILKAQLSEVNVLESLPPHPNVVRYLGRFTDRVPQEWVERLPAELLQIARAKPIRNTRAASMPTMQFVVYEYCECSLSSVLQTDGVINLPLVRQSLAWARDVCAALIHLSKHNIVHRDVKLENILLSRGRAVLADFGSALKLGSTTTVMVSEIEGNDLHQAPEVITVKQQLPGTSSQQPVNFAKQPTFELGVLLYELLTGLHPLEDYPAKYLDRQSRSVVYTDDIIHPLPVFPLAKQMVCCDPTRRPELSAVMEALKSALGDMAEVPNDMRRKRVRA